MKDVEVLQKLLALGYADEYDDIRRVTYYGEVFYELYDPHIPKGAKTGLPRLYSMLPDGTLHELDGYEILDAIN